MIAVDLEATTLDLRFDASNDGQKNLALPSHEYTEKPGLRKFFSLCGYSNLENLTQVGAFSYHDIFKSLLGDQDSRDNLANLIEVISEQDPDLSTDQILEKITVYEPRKKGKKRDSNLPDITTGQAIEILEKDTQADPDMREVLSIIIEEVRDRVQQVGVDEAVLEKIMPLSTRRFGRVERLAAILGIDSKLIEDNSLAQILEYLSSLSKEVDEMRDFSLAEMSYHATHKFIPETIMSEEVVPQTGTECVLYSTLNLANAAANQGAIVEPVSIPEMERNIPRGIILPTANLVEHGWII